LLARPLLTKTVAREGRQKRRVHIEFPSMVLRNKGEDIETNEPLLHLNE